MSSHAFEFELDNPLIAALDVDSAEECLRLANLLQGRVGAFKLGPRLIVRHGADLISAIAQKTPVFIDNKYLDIPSTMEAAIRASFEAGATLATVHAWSGPEALRLLAKVEIELNQIRPFKILAVTVLTSFSEETLPPALRSIPIRRQVEDLADLALECGIDGLVCSPQEVASLRSRSKAAFLVTPGVRLATDARGDQKRVETPAQALRSGASAFVVGRPIVQAADPVVAAEVFLAAVKDARS